jgi:hypothetical protein
MHLTGAPGLARCFWVDLAHARRPAMPMGNLIADFICFDGECKARLASPILISLSILSSRSVREKLQIG